MTVHLIEQGEGLPVVLLHGGLAMAELSWNEAMPLLAARYVLGGTVSEPHEAYLQGLHSWGFSSPGEIDVAVLAEDFGEKFFTETRAALVHLTDEDAWVDFLRQISRLWLTVPRYEDAQLATITEPTLVISGDRDEMAGVDQALRLYRTIPGAELAIIPGADHDAANRALFWETVLDFADRHGRSGADRPGR